MSEITVTVSQRTWIEAAVEVDVDEIIRTASEKDLRTLVTEAANKGVLSPDGRYGDGDNAYTANCIERAFLACKRMATPPPELVEFIWRVHGRAM